MAKLQGLLACFDPSVRKTMIMRLWEHDLITPGQAELLIQHNKLEGA